jgi:hypothetical protein
MEEAEFIDLGKEIWVRLFQEISSFSHTDENENQIKN